MKWISGALKGLVAFISAVAFLLLALTAAKLSGTIDYVLEHFGAKPTAVEQKRVEYAENQKTCAAYFVWHSVTGSNGYKYAGEEAEWLAFVAFWNSVKAGRPPCKVFADADPMLPEMTKPYQWQVTPYYWESKLGMEVQKDFAEFERIRITYGPLLGKASLADDLPDHLRPFECVTKFVRSNGGGLTTRLRLSLDQLAERMEGAGYQLVQSVPSPTPDGKPYRFYCPK